MATNRKDETAVVPRPKHKQEGYLVAEPAGFPGLRIPLLSDEECRARGIEPVRFPARETWTQAQRDAADRLVEILLPHAYLEALYVIQAEIEREGTDSKIPEAELETIGATRGIALIDAGKWKQRDTWVHFPPSWIRQILEMFARGDLSLLNPTQPKQRRKRARSKAGAVKPPT
jgi:hypothetical protein